MFPFSDAAVVDAVAPAEHRLAPAVAHHKRSRCGGRIDGVGWFVGDAGIRNKAPVAVVSLESGPGWSLMIPAEASSKVIRGENFQLSWA